MAIKQLFLLFSVVLIITPIEATGRRIVAALTRYVARPATVVFAGYLDSLDDMQAEPRASAVILQEHASRQYQPTVPAETMKRQQLLMLALEDLMQAGAEGSTSTLSSFIDQQTTTTEISKAVSDICTKVPEEDRCELEYQLLIGLREKYPELLLEINTLLLIQVTKKNRARRRMGV